MSVENGVWIMRGRSLNDPKRIRSAKELEEYVDNVGFLPLFAGDVQGFSVEEMTASTRWRTGDVANDPWEWRELIAAGHRVAYGKFFDKKAGFISLKMLPYFANARRNGYDFDSRYEDGLASRREKKIMDFYLGTDEFGETLYKNDDILSTELKKLAGFGKEGEKNYPGIMTDLQMQTYLVISAFRRRKNKKGDEYGMSVSIPLTPEAIWGRETVSAAYSEDPETSRQRLFDRVKELYPKAEENAIDKLIGKIKN